ncbi:MAG: hypothetical protein GY909_01765 [Oligoflexia bacterium]|nr:hypothetical protein [Oligoflexia bacterium]
MSHLIKLIAFSILSSSCFARFYADIGFGVGLSKTSSSSETYRKNLTSLPILNFRLGYLWDNVYTMGIRSNVSGIKIASQEYTRSYGGIYGMYKNDENHKFSVALHIAGTLEPDEASSSLTEYDKFRGGFQLSYQYPINQFSGIEVGYQYDKYGSSIYNTNHKTPEKINIKALSISLVFSNDYFYIN